VSDLDTEERTVEQRKLAINEFTQWLGGVDLATAKVADSPSTPRVILGDDGVQVLIDAYNGRLVR